MAQKTEGEIRETHWRIHVLKGDAHAHTQVKKKKKKERVPGDSRDSWRLGGITPKKNSFCKLR